MDMNKYGNDPWLFRKRGHEGRDMGLSKIGKLIFSAAGLLVIALTAGFIHAQEVTNTPASATPRRLPTGWRIRAPGRQVALDTMPVATVLLPDRKRALVLNSGYRPPSLALLNIAIGKVEHPLRLPDAGQNFAFDASSGRVYVAGGNASSIFVTTLSDMGFSATSTFRISWPGKEYGSLISDVALSTDGKLLFATEEMQQSVAVLDAHTGNLLRRFATVSRPSRVLPSSDGRFVYVAGAGEGRIAVHDIANGEILSQADVSSAPSDLLELRGRLYVAASGSNYVDVLEASPTLRRLERLNVALFPKSPGQATPVRLAYDPEASRLYVTCSDLNAVAVLEFDDGQERVRGYVPTGWYPRAAVPLPGSGLLILNGKGNGSAPNPRGPNPTGVDMRESPEYIPSSQLGSASIVDNLTRDKLSRFTEEVSRLTPREKISAPASVTQSNPVPLDRKRRSPIEHVILIMKENRTYDQVLGDLPQGNGDLSLCLFPERVSPNHHKLAKEFTLFDNFYVNADVSAEGWQWTSAAITPHFVIRGWPASYAGRVRPQASGAACTLGPACPAPAGTDSSGRPSAGYLWTSALKAGMSFRNYGFFVNNRKGAKPGEEIFASVDDPQLEPYTNRFYAGFDVNFPDVERARVFLNELKTFEEKGNLPRLITMVLPDDHTFGTKPGMLTPFSSVADNDLALGQIVEGVSHSRFWSTTAIFVVEDDAQDGPDHVDSHRSLLFVISPYTRRGFVDSNFYNTTAMLRTIELILGIAPLTQYDSTAPPILAAFQSRPDIRPYSHAPATISLTELSPANSKTAALSNSLDFSAPDRADEATLNAILWSAIKGGSPPPPTRSSFIKAVGDDDDHQ
jgi:DNA-binding beta-propeller fold protein YncE